MLLYCNNYNCNNMDQNLGGLLGHNNPFKVKFLRLSTTVLLYTFQYSNSHRMHYLFGKSIYLLLQHSLPWHFLSVHYLWLVDIRLKVFLFFVFLIQSVSHVFFAANQNGVRFHQYVDSYLLRLSYCMFLQIAAVRLLLDNLKEQNKVIYWKQCTSPQISPTFPVLIMC